MVLESGSSFCKWLDHRLADRTSSVLQHKNGVWVDIGIGWIIKFAVMADLVLFKFSPDVYVVDFVVFEQIDWFKVSPFGLSVEVEMIIGDFKEGDAMLVPFCPHPHCQVQRLRYFLQVEIQLTGRIVRNGVQKLFITRKFEHSLLGGYQSGPYFVVLDLKKLLFIQSRLVFNVLGVKVLE